MKHNPSAGVSNHDEISDRLTKDVKTVYLGGVGQTELMLQGYPCSIVKAGKPILSVSSTRLYLSFEGNIIFF